MNNTDGKGYLICFTTKTETLQCVYRRVKQASNIRVCGDTVWGHGAFDL